MYQLEDRNVYTGLESPPAIYLHSKPKLLLDLCREYKLPFHVPRFIPRDWRQGDYRISERLLNANHERHMQGKDWKNLYWAGQSI